MIYATTVISALLGAPVRGRPVPTWSKDAYFGEQGSLVLDQGGYADGNSVCCSTTVPQCKVQTLTSGIDAYEQGTKNRTLVQSARGDTLTWYDPVFKEMAVVPGSQANSSHKWACAAYCPTSGKWFSDVAIGDGGQNPVHDLGEVSITQEGPAAQTKTCEEYKWKQTLIGPFLPMSTTEMYVDFSGKEPTPFFKHEELTPFGQSIGKENFSFYQYTPMDLDPQLDIDPDSVTSCKMSDQCSDGLSASVLSAPMQFVGLIPTKPSLLNAAEAAAKRLLPPDSPAAAAAAPPPALRATPKFSADFTTQTDHVMRVAQGPVTFKSNGDGCCPLDALGQCQVQMTTARGTYYHDYTHNRTRDEDTISGKTTVNDYKTRMSMIINVTGGVETCQEYCPIDPRDVLDEGISFPSDAKDLGPTHWEGHAVEKWEYSDVILKVIKMTTSDWFVDQSGASPKPLFKSQAITPFGRTPPIGYDNFTYTSWVDGTPPAAKFNIQGVASCPKSSRCGSPARQMTRRRMGEWHGFSRYEEDSR